jgi:hypothetical protein
MLMTQQVTPATCWLEYTSNKGVGEVAAQARRYQLHSISVHTSINDWRDKICHFRLECLHSMSEIHIRIHMKRNRLATSALTSPSWILHQRARKMFHEFRDRSPTRKTLLQPELEAMLLGSGPTSVTWRRLWRKQRLIGRTAALISALHIVKRFISIPCRNRIVICIDPGSVLDVSMIWTIPVVLPRFKSWSSNP